MYVVAARFSAQTWPEHAAYRERKKLVGCVYGTPLPMAESIPYRAPVFVLEMNFQEHRIMGVGLVSNDCLVGVHHIYKDTQYNICAYEGKYRVDREEMTREEQEIMETFDEALFWKSKVWRIRNGLTQIPKWVRDMPDFKYKEVLRDMFVKRFRSQTEKTRNDNNNTTENCDAKKTIKIKKAKQKVSVSAVVKQ